MPSGRKRICANGIKDGNMGSVVWRRDPNQIVEEGITENICSVLDIRYCFAVLLLLTMVPSCQ